MGKYEPLREFLKSQDRAEIRMTFSQIEKLIGSKLPASAQEHRAWWSNNPSNSVITKAWLEAGYRTEDVDMAAGRLVFRRQVDSARRRQLGPQLDEAGLHPLIGSMKGTVTIAPGVDLTEPADPEWGRIAWDMDGRTKP